MTHPTSLLLVDSDTNSLETLTYAFEREGCKVMRTSELARAEELARLAPPELAIVSVRDHGEAALPVVGALRSIGKNIPVLVLGPATTKDAAVAAGAADFLRTPTFLRDIVTVARLDAVIAQTPAHADNAPPNGSHGAAAQQAPGEALLSDYHGLFYLLRAMAATERSGIIQLTRGKRQAELRIRQGTLMTANVGALQSLPALHHLLLWEQAVLSVRVRDVPKRGQFPFTAQEVLDECERFLRDFAHAARELGPSSTVYQLTMQPRPGAPGLQPGHLALLRLFDGKRGLADVVEESPFRIFDTIRMIRRLRDAGLLAARPPGRSQTGQTGKAEKAVAPAKNGAARPSMFAEWAIVPDARGVVGDRRPPSRPIAVESPLQRMARLSPTAVPIPLTNKKPPTGPELVTSRRRPTGGRGPALAAAAAVAPAQPAAVPEAPSPAAEVAPPAPALPKARRSAPPGSIAPFNQIEADFFAREADLYKSEAVDTFEDLDRPDGSQTSLKGGRRKS